MKGKVTISALLALVFSFALGIGTSRACEPMSTGYGAFCVCEPSGFELSGPCYTIEGEQVRRGLMNLGQPYGNDTRLEFISWKITFPDDPVAVQYITLARGDNVCNAGQTPGNTGNGCKAKFNVGQPPAPPTLMDIPGLNQVMLDNPGRKQNVHFNVSCDALALGGTDVTGKRFYAVAIVGFSKNGAPGTCKVDDNVKVQQRPLQGDVVQEATVCP